MKFFFAFIFFISFKSYALVDMQNANFTETFTAFDFPDSGYNLKIDIANNSRSLYNGIFGFGWCSNIETVLKVQPDGKIKRVECGGGQEITFKPTQFNQNQLQIGLNRIIEATKKQNPRITQRELAALRTKLTEDTFFRNQEIERLGIKTEVRDGTVFLNESNNTDKIVFKKNVYTRENPDGSSERFDSSGRLTFIYDKNQNFLKFEYSKDQLTSVSNNSGRKLSFSYTQNGKVREIRGPNNLNAELKYEKLNDLSFLKTAKNEIYSFNYDSLHNITQITYPDKTSKKLKYNQDKDWVTGLTDRNNCSEKYDYELSKEDPKNHYWSTVVKTCDGKVVNRSKYSFWFKPRKAGVGSFLARLAIDNNGIKSDIEYHEVFEKPTIIKNAKETIRYEYYPNGLLKTKRSNDSVVTFKYNKQNRVSEVTENKLVTRFEYDKFGNPIAATSSSGQSVRLVYNDKGQIIRITDQAKRLINLEYDDRFGKPKRVERPGVGVMMISYNNAGEMQKVESKNGDPTVVVQVASAVNNLMDIFNPAGISLGL